MKAYYIHIFPIDTKNNMDGNQNSYEDRAKGIKQVFQAVAAGDTQAVRQYLNSGLYEK